MFKATSPLLGGLLWKIPWRLSSRQKFRQRKRLRSVDNVVDTIAAALERNGLPQVKAVERWSRKRLQRFADRIPPFLFWTVRQTSITIVLKHTTVYYVALMNYHPSSCIDVTFKHFLVGIVSGR
uniref:54S ribosomal protein L31, mitochondrial n=1 Tax=Talaromyces marneffei PM1 TaxID=1077442 RepID=A0A093XB22_TALMA